MQRGADLRVRVIRNTRDPKCEVAWGLLENGVGVQDDSKDTVRAPGLPGNYYKGAANAFYSLFKEVFKKAESSGSNAGPMVDIPTMDVNQLSALAQKEMPAYGADINDAFRILMEVIYRYLESKPRPSRSAMGGGGKK